MYFIHNRYDAESERTRAALGSDVTVVDYYADPERYKRIRGLQKIPCFMDILEFEEEDLSGLHRKVEELSSALRKANLELEAVKAKQNTQESMLIECFTDLDASINGGGEDAELV